MCFNVQQKTSTKELVEKFNASFENPALYQTKDIINGFDYPLLPVLTSDSPSLFTMLNWGLIPHWTKNPEIRSKTLNARLETINEVASFKDVTQKRCILPVTGFYEWKWLDSKGKRKEKYLIRTKNDTIFGLGGLYSHWINPEDGKEINTFSLLTTEANPFMAEIHNIKKRMPLIMDAENAKTWLKNGDINLNHNLIADCIERDSQLNLF